MADYQAQKLECTVTFLAKSDEGWGRMFVPTLNGNWYRPHLVAGDPGQRKAKLTTHSYEVEYADGSKGLRTSNNWIDEQYLGVSFDTAPDQVHLNEPIRLKLSLMFWPHPNYEVLQPGQHFTVREGATVVGFGEVIRWLPLEPLRETPNPYANRGEP